MLLFPFRKTSTQLIMLSICYHLSFLSLHWELSRSTPEVFQMKKMLSSSFCLMRYLKLTEHARSPKRGSPKAAGLDLYSASSKTVPAKGKELIFIDLQIQFPDGCYGRIAPRSGLSHRYWCRSNRSR